MRESASGQGGQVLRGVDWASRAILCEMLAFTFRYPIEELARAVASGVHAEALAELCGRFTAQEAREPFCRAVAQALREFAAC